MNQTHDIPGFFIEMWKRLTGKTPKFFQIINFIAGACALITGLPGMVESVGIQLPPDLLVLQNKTVAIASLVALFIGKLPVQRMTVPYDNKGVIVGATHDELPFTAKKETQQIINADEQK